ncbi:TonB-dependent receptor family protein [Flavobacterium sp. ANB]|uniref:outer membrane beta-barrel family protein n=1 Tax=unclassified Flavobacterium TaxID=196869 RepID=UPI0012B78889|nr:MULTISPECIES: outer membrane beta-barrel family protein [unclassified Flavobacterium]MBF4519156.1 TonB-dependent receptor family protein [Flavobacterium sp. ANB]MTD71644.1 outer membrane beta-barrel protein [Flavobacterium sp. LC2016-13]
MKKIIIALLLLYSPTLFSQVLVDGKIRDQNYSNVQFAEIVILTNDSIAIKSELTNINGNFSIAVEHGSYLFQVKHMGQLLFSQKISLEENFHFGTIKVIRKEQLKEVVINKNKKLLEKKIDRLVFNVENSIVGTGGDAFDVVRATPTLIVGENSISIVGKSSVSVMIDERIIQLSGDDLSNLLRSIPSENIAKIEVITMPPAKYEAQGNSGLVNIVLKKARKNFFNGNIRTAYTQAKYGTGNIGGGINYQKNKLTVLSNFDFSSGRTAPLQRYDIFYPNYTWKENYNVKNSRDSYTGRIALDYQLTSSTSVGLEYNSVANISDIKSKNQSRVFNKFSEQLDSTLVTSSIKELDRKTNSLNFHGSTKLDTIGKKISFDLDYFQYNNSITNNFSTVTVLEDDTPRVNSLFFAVNDGSQDIKIYSSKFDVTLPMRWINFSFGGKLSFINNNNETIFYDITSDEFVLNPQKSNRFSYTESNTAAYASLNKELSKKWNVQLGLRLENTRTRSSLVEIKSNLKNTYTELFPSFYLTYATDNEATISLTYNRRIERPSYNLLNPFRIYSTETNYTEGNPYLSPYFSNNIELSCIKGNFYHSIFFNYINQGIDQITFTDSLKTYQYTIPYNFFTNKRFGISENYSFSKIKGWQSNNGINMFYTKTNSSLEQTFPVIKGLSVYVSSYNNFTLNSSKTFKAELNFIYQSASVSNSYKTTSYYKFDAAIKQELLNKKLQLAINVTDLFKTSAIVFSNNINDIQQGKFDYQDTQKIRFSAVYKFGKSIREDRREFSNKEEEKRTR